MTQAADDAREWLETDGLGGFASGTVGLVRTRRYHALLLTATTPPTGRLVLVNGFDAWIETAAGRTPVSAQRYQPGVTYPEGDRTIEAFSRDPWPTWTFRLDPTTTVRQEIFVPRGRARTIVSWTLDASPGHAGPVRLVVRPFLSGRDYHGTHHENGTFQAAADVHGQTVSWRPYQGVPAIVSRSNGRYDHAPDWYRRFLYTAETERGLDDTEDLVSPGWLSWELTDGEAAWILDAGEAPENYDALEIVRRARAAERARRASFASPLHRAADDYLVERGRGRTIIAGYPWFTDWGRDTFIALRGLCLGTGRFDAALDILREWAGAVSEGMLPNRFPDAGETPEFNAVDASLWFVIAVRDLLDAADRGETVVGPSDRVRLVGAVTEILTGYTRGTRYAIHADGDGLLACGVPGVQLTWMDARVGDQVITPRVGKPVEVQALWLAALAFGARIDPQWQMAYVRGHLSFGRRFWNDERGCLLDVVDVDHQPGRVDAAVRPNQILAVGGLGLTLIDPERARRVVDVVERELLTPYGLRSLAPGSPGYAPRYAGGPAERDRSYHQGTAWPWLAGPFVEAWLAVRPADAETRRAARERFLAPLVGGLEVAGLGHLSEIVDAEAPFAPRGCPFQAWSLGELIRIVRRLVDPVADPPRVTRRRSGPRVAESV